MNLECVTILTTDLLSPVFNLRANLCQEDLAIGTGSAECMAGRAPVWTTGASARGGERDIKNSVNLYCTMYFVLLAYNILSVFMFFCFLSI